MQTFYGSMPAYQEPTNWGLIIVMSLVAISILAMVLMAVMPRYNVWAARKRGEAELAEAQGDQQIQIAAARSRLAAAEMNRQAAVVEANAEAAAMVIDAKAVAESIKIIGDTLKGDKAYLQWQWIRMMEQRDGSTIYVPTEAGLPILEAGKRNG